MVYVKSQQSLRSLSPQPPFLQEGIVKDDADPCSGIEHYFQAVQVIENQGNEIPWYPVSG